MSTIFNTNDLHYQEDSNAIDNYRLQTAQPRLSQVVNSKHLYFDMRTLNPDNFSFPYHFHHNAEEIIMVKSGSMIMRTPEGYKELKEGDMVFFEIGKTGSHQFYNNTELPCVYLDIRTNVGYDIGEYVDSNKINLLSLGIIAKKPESMPYFELEENPKQHWKDFFENIEKGE